MNALENPHETIDKITRAVEQREKAFYRGLAHVTYDATKMSEYKETWKNCLYEARREIGSVTNIILQYNPSYLASRMFITIYEGQTEYAYQKFKQTIEQRQTNGYV